MASFIKKLFIFLLFLGFLVLGGAGAALYWLVAVDPGTEIELSNIESILGRESPVYYRDGEKKIGVLFQEAHRQYLPYDRIPPAFVSAIIAAEDHQFFRHFGIDLPGIARAMVANIRAGRIIQGGSTITQQTAKNLFKRESRTYRAKLKELLYALRLEYHYPKEKILEFYVNQFFVSGNGHGLGVAARYYFDKDVAELTLLEHAFIAGSVKRPNYYNPFTKSSPEAAERARKRAAGRAAYVLRNMRQLKSISQQEFLQASSEGIAFRRGRMSFALNTVMDLVRDGLSSVEITRALEEHGISNASTSGIRIFTTVDRDLQEGALVALRRELSRLDIRLRGYDREEVLEEYRNMESSGSEKVLPGAFLFGTVVDKTDDENGAPLVQVDLGKDAPPASVHLEGFETALTAFVRYTRHRWSKVGKNDLPLLLDRVRAGDRVYVSVDSMEEQGARLRLEKFPELQGGVLVLQEGAVRAMIGGMENRFYNRALSARRLMGSTFKPFLFGAALQLGWSPLDMLNNTRDVFVYQDIPYFPRPDHTSPHERVSMSWAGVHSENLAAVWLLYHLTDYLTPPRLREVAAQLELAPDPEGMTGRYGYFKQLIRDRYGIVVNRDVLRQAAYDRAVNNLEADLLFEGRSNEYARLTGLPYGLHFSRYSSEVASRLQNENIPRWERRELELRLSILQRNYLGLQESLDALEQNRAYFSTTVGQDLEVDPLALLDSESGNLHPIGSFWLDGDQKVVFSLRSGKSNWTPLSPNGIRERLEILPVEEQEQFWQDVLVEGIASRYTFTQLAAQIEKDWDYLTSREPYSMEVLTEVKDYRILVGLHYLIQLGRELGVSSSLEPVLSFPLGSNVISLFDAVRMYEGLVTGKRFVSGGDLPDEEVDEEGGSPEGLAIIDRIETVAGEVIYQRKVEHRTVVDQKTSAAVADILLNTVRYGTGRFASRNVRLASDDKQRQQFLGRLDLPVPLMGKTGTANDFRNAAFLGYVPVPATGESFMSLPGGYSVGVYVGFDDNKPMEKGSTHITGSAGALPTWSSVAQMLVNLDRISDRLDLADLSFNGLTLQFKDVGQLFVRVNEESGGAPFPGEKGRRAFTAPDYPAVLSYGKFGETGTFEPERYFRPFWKNR